MIADDVDDVDDVDVYIYLHVIVRWKGGPASCLIDGFRFRLQIAVDEVWA